MRSGCQSSTERLLNMLWLNLYAGRPVMSGISSAASAAHCSQNQLTYPAQIPVLNCIRSGLLRVSENF